MSRTVNHAALSPLQCMSPSFVPLRCEAGQCGRLLSGGDSCSPQCSQLTQCSRCIARPQCGWCAARGANGAGRCQQGGLDGEDPHSLTHSTGSPHGPTGLNQDNIVAKHLTGG